MTALNIAFCEHHFNFNENMFYINRISRLGQHSLKWISIQNAPILWADYVLKIPGQNLAIYTD
ncbi:hypothetical protein FOB73_07935 [Yersinia pseudotuberculosis]|nr:hypothetical protein FOB73_07935 [Yersinia pseudotuberculosis]